MAWRNIADWRAGVDFTPLKKLKARVDFRDYWLATVQDGLYSGTGTRTVFNAKATSNHVGAGVETQFLWTFSPKMTWGGRRRDLVAGLLSEAVRQDQRIRLSLYVLHAGTLSARACRLGTREDRAVPSRERA
jgi:hypothetical protein